MNSLDYRTRIYAQYATRFQDAGQAFDALAAEVWGRPYRAYLRGWLPANRGARILEVACGGGRLLHLLKSLGYSQLEGVDCSPEQVALSRQVIDPARVFEADVLQFLEAHPASYDLILGLDLIEHLTKEEALRFLDACHGALQPGGRLVLQTPNGESPWAGHMRYGDFTHEVGFTPNSLSRLLMLTGFDQVQSREVAPVIHGFRSLLRYLGWKGLRALLSIWNLIEIGNTGSGIYTRVMLISGPRRGRS